MALRPLTYISLCSGGGGLDLGIELAVPNARAVVCVEREAFAVAHLVAAMQAGFMADAPVWSDARTFDGRPWRGLVDGVIGGIPCQPHSLAGRKGGQHDERDLWSDARRIIVQCRPGFVLIENVGGMLSPGADEIAGAERVWRDLRKLGFAVEGGLFSASEVGAPHQRERVFILGVADAIGRGHDWHAGDEGRGPEQRIAAARAGNGHVADHDHQLPEHPEPRKRAPFQAEAGRRSDARGLGSRVDGRHAADDGGEDVGNADIAGSQGRRERPDERAGERVARTAGGELADAHQPELRRQPSARQLEVDERNAPLGIFPPGPGDADAWRSILADHPGLAPATEPGVRRMADGMAGRVDRLRMLGNGVVPLQAAYAVRTLVNRLAASGSSGAGVLVRMMK